MLLLGIDLGTSSIKVSVLDAATRECRCAVTYPPGEERDITARQPGWAEQRPAQWWADAQAAIQLANASGRYDPQAIGAIGIAYQMHGLVVVDKNQQVLRDSIIWCDSRAVPYGEAAFQAIGEARCLSHLLNSPGNFTAAKLAWVKENEPETYARIDKIMLPGDFLAMQLTGEITTSVSALSEGTFWDFTGQELSGDVLNYFGFDRELFPKTQAVFAEHGQLRPAVAATLGLRPGIPVSYKAGDQPNNALSLNVLHPGEVAATAGTSGVIYAVTDQLLADRASRVNAFAHVNHRPEAPRLGVLLCINGAGSLNRWTREVAGAGLSYPQMNAQAATVPAGSAGLLCLPFGNGAERMLNNRQVGAHFQHLDLNRHTAVHLFRAAQEGVAYAFRYGLDVLRENGLYPSIIRAGHANLFRSEVFTQAFVNSTGVAVELHETDGSVGAALGAGIGAGAYAAPADAFASQLARRLVEPDQDAATYEDGYQRWLQQLQVQLAARPDFPTPLP
ncbi:xylulokinase [uncultured Hymenobacter sp.]|uniref:xylulokinase n=1 Tax=uncultured Hymenobacter sp. TaxID=170016 RepID=UPI0035CC77DB